MCSANDHINTDMTLNTLLLAYMLFVFGYLHKLPSCCLVRDLIEHFPYAIHCYTKRRSVWLKFVVYFPRVPLQFNCSSSIQALLSL